VDEAIRSDPTPGSVHPVRWDKDVAEVPVDLEVRFRGPNIGYTTSTVAVWRSAFDRLSVAYRVVANALADERNLPIASIPSPVVAFVGQGSVIVGLRAHEQVALFPSTNIDTGLALDSMRLMVEASSWAQGDDEALVTVAEANPILLDASLRAVEELAPASDEDVRVVELIPRFDSPVSRKSIELTEVSRKRVVDRRAKLFPGTEDARSITIVGVIDGMKLHSNVHMELSSESISKFGHSTAQWRYDADMLPVLLRSFGQRVLVSGMQQRLRGRWSSSIRVLDIVRAKV